jgi:hypothetical protein
MSAWTATTLVLAMTVTNIAATADAGSCGSKNSQLCANNGQSLDLNSVKEITNNIVGNEPAVQTQYKSVKETPAASPYTGPIVGVTSGKRAATIGYSWSLE